MKPRSVVILTVSPVIVAFWSTRWALTVSVSWRSRWESTLSVAAGRLTSRLSISSTLWVAGRRVPGWVQPAHLMDLPPLVKR
jgi:hypothetical protein